MTLQTTTAIRVRDAEEADRAAIREVTLAAFAQYAAPLGERWPDYRSSILRTLEHPAPALQVVAEVGGSVVGSGLLYPAGTVFTAPNGRGVSAPFPELRLLAVLPALRGRGVGTALMRERVARARAWRAEAVMFHTTAPMQAEPLYRRVGNFVRAPELDFQITPDVQLTTYFLRLEPDPPRPSLRP